MATKRSRADLNSEIDTQYPNNTSQQITPATHRGFLGDLVLSLAVNQATNGQLPVLDANGDLVDSSVSEGAAQVGIEKPCVIVPSELRIGSTGLRTFADFIYLQSSRTGRMFIPSGTPFTTAGSANPMAVKLSATAELPAAAQQTATDTTLAMSIGDTHEFISPGAAGVDHLLQSFVTRASVAGTVRLELFIGSDATGDKVIDMEYAIGTSDTTIVSEAYPRILTGQNYFSRITAVTAITLLGTGTGVNFRPYQVSTGWPYSELRILSDDDAAHIADLLEALTGDDRLDYSALRNVPLSGAAFLTATNLPVDSTVTSGVWGRDSFDGVHFHLDSTQVTGDITSINADSGTTFGADTFFAISSASPCSLGPSPRVTASAICNSKTSVTRSPSRGTSNGREPKSQRAVCASWHAVFLP